MMATVSCTCGSYNFGVDTEHGLCCNSCGNDVSDGAFKKQSDEITKLRADLAAARAKAKDMARRLKCVEELFDHGHEPRAQQMVRHLYKTADDVLKEWG
jgi:hypothetical protein